MVAMAAVMLSTGRTRFAGLFQLLYSLAAIPWMGAGAFMLSRFVAKEPGGGPIPSAQPFSGVGGGRMIGSPGHRTPRAAPADDPAR